LVRFALCVCLRGICQRHANSKHVVNPPTLPVVKAWCCLPCWLPIASHEPWLDLRKPLERHRSFEGDVRSLTMSDSQTHLWTGGIPQDRYTHSSQRDSASVASGALLIWAPMRAFTLRTSLINHSSVCVSLHCLALARLRVALRVAANTISRLQASVTSCPLVHDGDELRMLMCMSRSGPRYVLSERLRTWSSCLRHYA
jgi:hypothetical protein